MLQIISGKFFKTHDLYITKQRGILYTNYRFFDTINTDLGFVSPIDNIYGINSSIYEFEQKLEKIHRNGQKNILVAVPENYIVQDFSAILSFTLNALFTDDIDLLRKSESSNYGDTQYS
jgi:hypothetical protein